MSVSPRLRGEVERQLCQLSGTFSRGQSSAAVGQVHPIKPVLKAPGTILVKLRCDGPLSNVAFNFNLRRQTSAAVEQLTGWKQAFGDGMVGRCRLNLSNPVESTWN